LDARRFDRFFERKTTIMNNKALQLTGFILARNEFISIADNLAEMKPF
jgi:hypothetical protein